MFETIQSAKYQLGDVSQFIETLDDPPHDLFEKNREIFITRSPGRLDVMGGIADYSGALVLEMPIAEAVLAALQKSDQPTLKILSDDRGATLSFEMPCADFRVGEKLIEYAEARAYFAENESEHWAAYVAGVFLVLMREKGFDFEGGVRIFISSRIPQGKGVASSAALEAAVMKAVISAFEINVELREMAMLCQKVENLVVGAPCGIMDQMSVICGRQNQLLSMVCQPAVLRNGVSIPDEISFWGIDSGIRHSVSGADYGSVRTGAFIGYRMIADLVGLRIEKTEIPEVVKIGDEKWRGYLANITPSEFEEKFARNLPEAISGAEFLDTYGGISDTLTKVSFDKNYAVFAPTAHPIYENFRVRKFAALLAETTTENSLNELGELMFRSHQSYSACGLGSPGTDLLVELVNKNGLGKGLYGAKITGGGSGGTVAVLGRRNAEEILRQIVKDYAKQTGYEPYIFTGSSPGAADFGLLKVKKN